MGETNEMRI